MRKTNDHQTREPLGSDYWTAIYRYLAWLGVVCLIAALYAGPVMLFVWLAVAFVLTRDPKQQTHEPPGRPCNHSKKRRC